MNNEKKPLHLKNNSNISLEKKKWTCTEDAQNRVTEKMTRIPKLEIFFLYFFSIQYKDIQYTA